MTVTETPVEGWTAPGFADVRDVFEKSFADGVEVGASFAAYHRGELVVDLWGGVADLDTERPWDRHTIAVVYSSTKGATAICANRLAQEGLLDVEAPVADYWPEFARAGKAGIPVSSLLSHQAGLAWVDEHLTQDDVLAWDPLIHALERQKPLWEPGTAQGYHAVTYGHLVGEVVRRITGKTVGTYLREEIAGPLGLDFWIGLPEEHEPRVARLVGGFGGEIPPEVRELMDQFVGPETMLGKALTVNGAMQTDAFNTREVHAAEIPAAGGITDARSLARLYASCVSEVDGIRVLTPEQVRAATIRRTVGPNIVILNLDLQFGLGFIVPSSLVQLGGPGSFGHFGLGGSAGWADPDAELAFGYVMNRLELGLAGDQRSYSLINACYDAIGEA
jgi:CubicO group peptidase (beta-lactamase class C family)